MNLKIMLPQFVASVSTGLLAGAFMYGFLNVVPTFYEVPLNVHLSYRTQLMNHNSITMQSLMVASIAAPLWYAFVIRSKPAAVLAIVAALLALTSLLVTRFGNVPINQLIKTWSVGNLPADWKALLRTWDKFNLVRSLSALGCFLSFIAATLVSRPHK